MGLMDDGRGDSSSTLSTDLLTQSVLSNLHLHCLVRFSTCSKGCHDAVFDKIPRTAWSDIRFCRDDFDDDHGRSTTAAAAESSPPRRPHRRCTLTDDQLAAFLQRTRAREHTRRLSLAGCVNVTGRGLAPLAGSSVLESIDLRVRGCRDLGGGGESGEGNGRYGPTGLDDERVLDVLSTMLPLVKRGAHYAASSDADAGNFALRRIVFRQQRPRSAFTSPRWDYSDFGDLVSSFMRCHFILKVDRYASLIRGNDCGICNRKFNRDEVSDPFEADVCTTCNDVVCSHSERWSDSFHCSLCRGYFCSTNKKGIHCPICRETYCNACARSPSCDECTTRKCQWCSNVVDCNGCGKRSCAGHGFEACDGNDCEKSFCVDCQNSGLAFCMVCNLQFCSGECHKCAH